MTTESRVQADIICHLIDTGWLVLRINSGQDHRRFFYYTKWYLDSINPNTAGCLDILAFRRHDPPLAIDAKAPGKINNISDDQKRFIAAWRAAGGIAIVTDSLDKLKGELEQLLLQI